MQTLARLLKEHEVMHVCGTPASGKSTLARLLHDYLSGTQNVILINKWDYGTPAREFSVGKCHYFGHWQVQTVNLLHADITFIIDEAQQTYDNSDLWYTIIKTQIDTSIGPQFCLFSSYGSPSMGAP